MSRFLFVVAPFVGHVHRMRPYAEELAARGHDVAWVAHIGLVGEHLPPGQHVFGLPDGPARAAVEAHRRGALDVRFAPAVMKAGLDEVALPLARASLAGIESALDAFVPDCLVNDAVALGGPLAARVRGLRWASSTPPGLLADERFRVDAVLDYLRERLEPIQRELGLDPVAEPSWSEHLVLVNSVREFVGDVELSPAARLVGASLGGPRAPVDFPWELLDGRPAVLASLGTIAEHLGRRFFGTLAEALAGEPVQVVAAAAPELLPSPPPNFVVRPFVPQLDLMARVDAVVSHAGHNTVVEALVHGRPLVVAPIAYEQPYTAARVAACGAGLRVRFTRPRVEELRTAVRRVLDEPSFRTDAARLGGALRRAGGAATAADALEELAVLGNAVPAGAP